MGKAGPVVAALLWAGGGGKWLPLGVTGQEQQQGPCRAAG